MAGQTVEPQLVKSGDKAVKPEDPTMKGYNFLGWFDKDGNPFDFDTEITHKTELKAQWEKKDYIIASDLRVNGGEAVKDEGKTYAWTHRYGGKYEETINYQPMFDALKARALEADKANEPNTTRVDVELRFPGSKDRLFNEEIHTYGQEGGGWNPGVKNTAYIWGYAWTYYDVTFVTGVAGQTVEPQLVKSGDKATEPTDVIRLGYDFKGWYTDEALTIPFTFDTPITHKTTLYAKWEARTDTPYTVEHYLENLDGSYALDTIEPLKGTTDTTVTAAAKSYDNFTYDSTVPGTVASGNIAGDGSLVLKLFYTRNTYDYTVRHIKQLPDGTYDEANAKVENLSGKFEAIATVNAKDYGSHYPVNDADEKQDVQIEKGLVIEVHYDLDEHTLTFDAKGGTETDSVTVRHGNTVAKPEDPKRSGYRFTGWFDDEKCKEAHDFDAPLEEDATVYAGWTKRSSGSSVQIESPNKPKKDDSLKFNTAEHFAFVNGYPDGTVKPTGDVTRAEVAAILYRVMDADCVKTYETTRCSFSDVVRGDWFNLYVATLENAGVIVDTRTNGKFRPNEAITRAELAAMLAQFADIKSAANSFNDVSARHWASDEIAVCAKMGWINGYPDGSFRPDATITRAEMMAMINRALDRTPKSADDLLSGMKTWRDNANVNAWYYLDVQEATNSHTYTKSGTHETWKKLR